MTHQELLAEIHDRLAELHGAEVCDGFTHALLAVVELHKPVRMDGGFITCMGCSQSPCSTIQAIEKELK